VQGGPLLRGTEISLLYEVPIRNTMIRANYVPKIIKKLGFSFPLLWVMLCVAPSPTSSLRSKVVFVYVGPAEKLLVCRSTILYHVVLLYDIILEYYVIYCTRKITILILNKRVTIHDDDRKVEKRKRE